MGVQPGITHNTFPEQSHDIGRRCKVCFCYDTTNIILGTVRRDDRAEPFQTIIELDDGRIVLGSECQFLVEMETSTRP